MKEIQPINFPLNLGTAIYLSCAGNDNFNTCVIVYYQLLNINLQPLQSGNLTMDGADYESYNTSNNGNEYIYNWSANQLGVTLI
jgi:hypothetical protein